MTGPVVPALATLVLQRAGVRVFPCASKWLKVGSRIKKRILLENHPICFSKSFGKNRSVFMYSKCGVMSRRNKIVRLCCQRRFRELAEFRGILDHSVRSFRWGVAYHLGLGFRRWLTGLGPKFGDLQAVLADENYR